MIETSPDYNFRESLIEHPEIQAVECYFFLEENQFRTIHWIAEQLKGKWSDEIVKQAVALFLNSSQK